MTYSFNYLSRISEQYRPMDSVNIVFCPGRKSVPILADCLLF